MFMRYSSEGVGHCHNTFLRSLESVDEASRDDEMDIDDDSSVEGGAEEHEEFDSVDLDSGDNETDEDDYSGDGGLDSDDEADGEINHDLDTLF